MTLERHRSPLIPDINISGDGTLFVTDTGGTFPLRGKKTIRHDIREHEYKADHNADSYTHRSYSEARDYGDRNDSKRLYKQRPSGFGSEAPSLSGTVSTRNSSLGRRLRRSKRKSRSQTFNEDAFEDFGTYGTLDSGATFSDSGTVYGRSKRGPADQRTVRSAGGSVARRSSAGSMGRHSYGGTTRRLRAGPPKMPAEFAATMKRNKLSKSLDMAAINEYNNNSIAKRNKSKVLKDTNIRRELDIKSSVSESPLFDTSLMKSRQLTLERVPYIVFLIDGPLLIIMGIVTLLISYWHVFGCAIWTGILILCLGIIGAKHKEQYLRRKLTVSYIALGVVSTFAVIVSMGTVLGVVVNILVRLADEQDPTAIAHKVTFSNMGSIIIPDAMNVVLMTWVTVALHISTLVLLGLGLHSLTAASICLSNFWDANYNCSGECDHRGNPRYFNPLQQAVTGVATSVIGVAYVVLLEVLKEVTANRVPRVTYEHYYSPVWAGFCVIAAGIISFCFGKRLDLRRVGAAAIVLEMVALAACAVSMVFTIQAVVGGAATLTDPTGRTTDKDRRNELIAMCVLGAVFDILICINVIFIVGLVFRNSRKLGCYKGTTDNEDTKL